MPFAIAESRIPLSEMLDLAFLRRGATKLSLSSECRRRVDAAHALLTEYLERNVAIYGVTTGFGDNNRQAIDPSQTEALQRNLVAYLMCGTGKPLPRAAVRGMCVARLVSLTRGHSGVSWALIEQLQSLIEHDILPVVPCEGSLGASGDLVPLAYLADLVQGQGLVDTDQGPRPAEQIFKEHKLKPYTLQAKEGLALVNGTSTMAGLALVNHAELSFIADLALHATAWLCLVVEGRRDSFGTLVNEKAKLHHGQRHAAAQILALLEAEQYQSEAAGTTRVERSVLDRPVQDRYSLRCAPQIMGPVLDTLATFADWLELEINSVSDNPLLDADERLMATGGNFYGGYLGHGMDYFKVCIASTVDMLDRQLMLMFDPKTSAGLPTNLADWAHMAPDERHLHHGLKGLHQVTNAITAEVCSMSMPTTVFSRSSESHNQDKVSLGLSAGVACAQMLDKAFTVCSLALSCLAQALDLRGRELQGAESQALYAFIRRHVPFVKRDVALGSAVANLASGLRDVAHRKGKI